MNRTAVINVVGLTGSLIGSHTPKIAAFLRKGTRAAIVPAFPAVTCTAQSSYLTGRTPEHHGIVANGWYDRDLAEVQFWKQSDHLVQGRKIWEELREENPSFTCAKLFWWYNMYSKADYSITPRPMYPADGRKVFDIYTWPYSIRTDIKQVLGEFPFPGFWGPAAGVDTPQGSEDAASRWIAESAKWIEEVFAPTLNLIYLPHLDYNLQRHGPYLLTGAGLDCARPDEAGPPINPAIQRDLHQIDSIVGDLISFFQQRSIRVLLLSEYGITNVDTPIHLNRLFRQMGWLTVKEELGLELLDCGASRVFAVADHQVAHIYMNDRSIQKEVRTLLESTDSIGEVLAGGGKASAGIDHPRAGDLIAIARENCWFTYYYWMDDKVAPDFARCVDIHRKPGYDPVELFLDPKIVGAKLRILGKLLKKQLGFRMLMDVIPLDATLVKGSHGCRPSSVSDYPILITDQPSIRGGSQIEAQDVYQVIRRLVTE